MYETTLLQSLSILLILSTLALLWMKRIVAAVQILAIQSLLLGAIAFITALSTHTADLYVMSALTVLVKAIGIPGLLWLTMRKIGLRREAEKMVSRELSLMVGTALLVLGYVLTAQLSIRRDGFAEACLPISLAMLLIGLFIMITHRKVIMQGIGLIVMENGLFLAALSMTYGMPLLVDLGGFLDLSVAAVLISLLTYRMDQTFQSIDTEHLRRLRG